MHSSGFITHKTTKKNEKKSHQLTISTSTIISHLTTQLTSLKLTEISYYELETILKENQVDILDKYLTDDPSLLTKKWLGDFTLAHAIAKYARSPKMVLCLEKHLKLNNQLDLLFAEDLALSIPLHYAAEFNQANIVLAFLAMLEMKKRYDAVTWVNRKLIGERHIFNSYEAAKFNPNPEVLEVLKPYAYFNSLTPNHQPLNEDTIASNFPEVKENEELALFLKYGYRTVNAVANLDTEAGTDPKFNHLDQKLMNDLDVLIEKQRNEYDKKAEEIEAKYPNDPVTKTDKLLELNYELVMKYKKAANCMELAYLCFREFRKIAPLVRGEVVYFADDDHWFFVIGRAMNSDINDYKTWENAVIVDHFGKTRSVYPASHIPQRLKYYYWDKTYKKNIVGRVNTNVHYFTRDLYFDPKPEDVKDSSNIMKTALNG